MNRPNFSAWRGAATALLVISCLMPGPAWADSDGQGPSKAAIKAAYNRALAGDGPSQVYIGTLYAQGKGVPKNPVEAARWFRKAALRGYAPGAYWLARAYEEGLGAPISHSEAVHWLERAAKKRFAPAETMLGNAYASGQGVPRNERQAAEWYRKGADHGDREAKAKLILMVTTGAMYGSGDGGLSPAEGIGWLTRTADHGDALAQDYLGLLRDQGQGKLHDPVAAYKWYSLASAQGDPDATARLHALEATLSANQKAAGQAAAVAWWHRRRR